MPAQEKITAPVLVPVGSLEPALYNPREADQERLNYLKFSIKNLGFILPLYATENGHLLSGHQRLTVAMDLGCKEVPVIFLPGMDDKKRKNINLLFNRRLAVDEPVVTPEGCKRIGDMCVGDSVMGRDGKPHKVLSVSDVQERVMYDVEFDEGTVIRADAEHLWTVDYTNLGGNSHYIHRDTLNTIDIQTRLNKKGKVAVPTIAPVAFPDKEYFISPYLLGVLLGDGSITQYGCRLHSAEGEWMFSQVKKLLPTGVLLHKVNIADTSKVEAVDLVGGTRGGIMSNPIVHELRRLGIAGLKTKDKYIPVSYLWGSIAQRLSLLQGLMDTDGCSGAGGGKTPIFTSTSRELCEGVVFLVNSLGGKAALRIMRKKVGNWNEAYQVTVRLPAGVSPFRMPIKQKAYKENTKHRLRKRIVSIREAEVSEAVCISIDAPDHLYLAKNFIPTHNTTNDMGNKDNSEVFLNQLEGFSLEEAVKRVKEKDPCSPDFFPCMNYELIPVKELLAGCSKLYDGNAAAMCKRLVKTHIVMPCIRSDTGNVVNGTYRLYAYAEIFGNDALYPCITIPEADAQVAEAMVNLISMKFTVEDQFANILRYGGFRRPTNKVDDLVQSMRFFADGNTTKAAHKSLKDPEVFWHKWRALHGETILDFGAGQRRNELIIQKKGIHCCSWEPYPCDWKGETEDKAHEPSLELSRKLTDHFLEEVNNKQAYSSIFANAVLNSVPFHKDRMCCLAVIHACCNINTTVYGTVKSMLRFNDALEAYSQNTKINEKGEVSQNSNISMFTVPYEEGVILADITKAPKVQKHHTPASIQKMLEVFWKDVTIHDRSGTYLFFEAKSPKRVNKKVLKEAIELEFNLPYPDGKSIDRQRQALEAFGQRHGIDLDN